MTGRGITALLLAFLLVVCAGGALADARTEGITMRMEEYEPLHALAEQHGFQLGAAFSHHQLKDENYKALITRHFGSVTPTNELKAYSLLDHGLSRLAKDGMPVMNYGKADAMVRFAQENGLTVRGHVLVWDAYMNDWFFREGYSATKPYASREVMLERLRSYIFQVVTHFEEKFPGVVYCWDVVNEAVGDGGDYQPGDVRRLRKTRSGNDNLFYKCIGDDYVQLSFLYAREAARTAGADIKLFYNDYNAFMQDKGMAIRQLIRSVNSYTQDENGANVKLCDGVGMQGYIGGYGTQSGCMSSRDIESVKKAVKAYDDMGLEVQLTEVALRNYQGDDASIQKHAAFCGDFAEMLTTLNAEIEGAPFTGFCIWGLFDAPSLPKSDYSYMLNSPYCGLVTEDYQIKTAFDAVYRAFGAE